MAAEYLSGASLRDAQRPVYNSVYDYPVVGGPGVNLGYTHWYLWAAYLLQKAVGDTTAIEDDLVYKWIRKRNAAGLYDNGMHGLASVLDTAATYLEGTDGRSRVRNLFHNYSLAKWINNPSSTLHGGMYGFGRGVRPYAYPGMFDNSFNPRDKRSAVEVPPKFVVDQVRTLCDSTLSNHRWCFTDVGQGQFGTTDTTFCDTTGLYCWGADYIQFEAAPYFENSAPSTFHCKITWDPTKYPDSHLLAIGRQNLRVTALTYASRSDSLYRRGDLLQSVVEGVLDTLQGTCTISIPGFGRDSKSVVLVLDIGQEAPTAAVNLTTRNFFYDYSFGVTESTGIDVSQSYFVPETEVTPGNIAQGSAAISRFRTCPNTDGNQVLSWNSRIRIVLRDAGGNGIAGIQPADVFFALNGGSVVQGFTGCAGADSIIANRQYNPVYACPDVRFVTADAPTDANGVTFITFLGSTPGNPGFATRDTTRKWGHYDSKLPVYAMGKELAGRLTTASPNGSYVLQIKNMDTQLGMGTGLNQGEVVNSADINPVQARVGQSDSANPINWWYDFDSNGLINSLDLNLVKAHNNDTCHSPLGFGQ